MQRLEVSGAVRHIYASLGFKGLMEHNMNNCISITCKFTNYNKVQSEEQTTKTPKIPP